jgi:hypothetical protein
MRPKVPQAVVARDAVVIQPGLMARVRTAVVRRLYLTRQWGEVVRGAELAAVLQVEEAMQLVVAEMSRVQPQVLCSSRAVRC